MCVCEDQILWTFEQKEENQISSLEEKSCKENRADNFAEKLVFGVCEVMFADVFVVSLVDVNAKSITLAFP